MIKENIEVRMAYQATASYNNEAIINSPSYTNNPAYPQAVQPPVTRGFFANNQKNKPQSNAATAACFVFISGGMNIAWSFIYTPLLIAALSVHILICWFIAAIIGAIVGAALCNHIRKKEFNIAACILIIIGGILYVALPENVNAIITARYFNGFANGLVFVPTMVMTGELSLKSNRGIISSSIEVLSFSSGIFVEILIVFLWRETFLEVNIFRSEGIIFIVYGVIGLFGAFFLLIESPVYYLLHNQELEAINSLRRLQRPAVVTTETYEQFEEHKRYIALNENLSLQQSLIHGLPALIKLCIYRALAALTFSLITFNAMQVSALIAIGPGTVWPTCVWAGLRFCGVFFAVFTIDSLGRKKSIMLGALVVGGLAFGVGANFNDILNILDSNIMTLSMSLLITMQFFSGIFVAASSAYLSEAFPLAVKPFYIAISFILEMLLQIILIACDKTDFSMAGYFFAIGCLLLVVFALCFRFIPETRRTTLREAQEKFRTFIN